eukprot:scaffold6843_cov47-Cyclotella_meneghiniana.AAC.1
MQQQQKETQNQKGPASQNNRIMRGEHSPGNAPHRQTSCNGNRQFALSRPCHFSAPEHSASTYAHLIYHSPGSRPRITPSSTMHSPTKDTTSTNAATCQ